MQSLWVNTMINCEKLTKITNLLPSTYKKTLKYQKIILTTIFCFFSLKLSTTKRVNLSQRDSADKFLSSPQSDIEWLQSPGSPSPFISICKALGNYLLISTNMRVTAVTLSLETACLSPGDLCSCLVFKTSTQIFIQRLRVLHAQFLSNFVANLLAGTTWNHQAIMDRP